jgi:hypothetical protein
MHVCNVATPHDPSAVVSGLFDELLVELGTEITTDSVLKLYQEVL